MNTIRTKHRWEPYLWLLPSVIMLAVFVVYPIILVFRLSFSEISKSGVLGGFVYRMLTAPYRDPGRQHRQRKGDVL